MKKVVFIFVIILHLNGLSACTQSGVVTADESATNSVNENAKIFSPEATSVASSPPAKTEEDKNLAATTNPIGQSPDDSDLQEQITNNLGSLIVATFYKPHFVEGDFNGDQLIDAAVVVGAEDRYGERGEIGDLFAGLPYLSEGISLQNMRTNGTLLAKPKQSAIEIEKNKTKLKAKSKLGLLIILSGSGDWKTELSKTNFDRKFLLMDALFGSDFDNKEDNTKWLSIVKKGEECLPSGAKGEGIFSGDAESAGKVIYFNGKNFAWTQCGD